MDERGRCEGSNKGLMKKRERDTERGDCEREREKKKTRQTTKERDQKKVINKAKVNRDVKEKK